VILRLLLKKRVLDICILLLLIIFSNVFFAYNKTSKEKILLTLKIINMRKIPFSLFNVDGYFTLVDQCIEVLKKFTVEDADYKALVLKLQELFKLLTSVMLKATTSVHTQKIFQLDAQFNKAFSGFRNYVKACSSYDEMSEAAELLIAMIKKHGWRLEKLGYTAQNSRAENLIHEATTSPAIKQAIIDTNSTVWFERVVLALNNLREGIQQRNIFVANLPKLNTEDVSKDINPVLENAISYIQLKTIVSNDVVWTDILKELEVVIHKNISVARLSGSRKEITQTDEQMTLN